MPISKAKAKTARGAVAMTVVLAAPVPNVPVALAPAAVEIVADQAARIARPAIADADLTPAETVVVDRSAATTVARMIARHAKRPVRPLRN